MEKKADKKIMFGLMLVLMRDIFLYLSILKLNTSNEKIKKIN